ncbi:putative Metallophosphoesterase [Candidatus Zixiibacteriota bacterium]|nr:putative Metallophosphoesterase [candidate division Zixibacteria bacterium]
MVGIYPLIFSLVVLTVFSLLEIFLIRVLNRVWWKHRLVRWGAYFLPLLGIISITIWFSAMYLNHRLLGRISSVVVSASLILLVGLTLSLPISGILNLIHSLLEKRKARKKAIRPGTVDPNRRLFLKGTAAALPLFTIATGTTGVARAFQETRVFLLPMTFDNLPPQLHGFRILHMTDSHLGIYKFLDDIENILVRADTYKPDLILYTGDIADRLSLLPETLDMVVTLKTRHGIFASLGNHEYYRGITNVLRAFDAGRVPLLRSSGILLDINGAKLYIGGADDPRVLRKDNRQFLKTTVSLALEGAPDDAFKIVMTHRPEGFDPAAENNVNLVLAGHTHGSQVGLAGHSVFTPLLPGRYLWGHYAKGNSQMYLSSGIGHWFPFRLGCPPEAPVIELRSRN